ncbi:MAG: Bro-N domain-containing protein [Selenomonadaceae bacterium]|nr:Bro-N domain-containing protein [Selenomonadaceae bacterium]
MDTTIQNALQIFTNETIGANIRVIMQNGELFFVANDVCSALDLGNARQALTRLDDDEKADVILNDTSSNGVTQKRSYNVVNESGLYTLILGSRKPSAKQFKRWITHDVIPSIRKFGFYSFVKRQPVGDDYTFDTFMRTIKVGDHVCVPTSKDIFAIGELAQSIAAVYQIDYDIALLCATDMVNLKWKTLDGLQNALVKRMKYSNSFIDD